MFGRSRPVPSKATLRFFYQLAYISSGTAAGIATLCTEERRRQTAIVQKIADNAKRIRQSPRYRHTHHHAAAAAAAAADAALVADQPQSDLHHAELPADPEPDPSQDAQLERRQSRVELERALEHRAAHAAEIPSAVEQGYEQLAKNRMENKRNRVKPQTSQPSERGRSARPPAHGGDGKILRRRIHHTPSVLPASASLEHDVMAGTIGETPSGMPSAKNQSLKPLPAFRVAPLVGHNPFSRLESRPTRKSIKKDVETFFRHVLWAGPDGKDADFMQLRAASWLLGATESFGLFDEVRSLSTWWKLSTSTLSRKDIRRISCWPLPNVVERLGLWSDIQEQVFRSRIFQKRSPENRAYEILCAAAAWCKAGPGSQQHVDRLMNLLLAMNDLSSEILQLSLKKVCADRLGGDCGASARLLVVLSKKCRFIFLDIHDKMITYAMENAEHNVSIRLLRLKLQAECERDSPPGPYLIAGSETCYCLANDPLAFSQLDLIAMKCGELKNWVSLGKLFHSEQLRFMPTWLDSTSIKARVYLAVACFRLADRHGNDLEQDDWRKAMLRMIRDAIPTDSQVLVDEEYVRYYMIGLWKRTWNLEAVSQEYQSAKKLQLGRSSDSNALGPAEVAVIEIFNLAKQPDRALEILSAFQKHGGQLGREAYSLLAVALAEKSAWEDLDRLFQSASEFQLARGNDDRRSQQRLNDVIRLYCRKHSLDDCWRFVERMVDQTGFVPDSLTNELMLQCCVASEQLDSIYSWRKSKFAFDMNARLAASLLCTYWEKQRPPHTLLMWQCRQLCRSPGVSFDALAFQEVMQRAAEFDLRELDARSKHVKYLEAALNLKAIRAMQDAIPTPICSKVNAASDLTSPAPQDKNEDAIETGSNLPPRAVFREMLSELSLQRNQKVVDLYEATSDGCLPVSPRVLELAVKARIRLDGGSTTGARHLLDRAQKAGFNSICAMGPIVTQEVCLATTETKNDVEALRQKAIEYYRSSHENGWAASPHVGTTVANVLINRRHAEHGINLLNTMYTDQWCGKDERNIVTMAVYFRGFAAMRNMTGVRWVVDQVLSHKMRITRKFLGHILAARHEIVKTETNLKGMRYNGETGECAAWVSTLKGLLRVCFERRVKQRLETKKLGRMLIKIIRNVVREQEASRIIQSSPKPYKLGSLSEKRAGARRVRVRRARARRARARRASWAAVPNSRDNLYTWRDLLRAKMRSKSLEHVSVGV